jgi:hypothetical protein
LARRATRRGNADPIEQPNKQQPVTLRELLVATLAQADVLAKLLIEKVLFTREE